MRSRLPLALVAALALGAAGCAGTGGNGNYASSPAIVSLGRATDAEYTTRFVESDRALHDTLARIDALAPSPGETLSLDQLQRLGDLGDSLSTHVERLAPHDPPYELAPDVHTYLDALRAVSADVDAVVAAEEGGGDVSTSKAKLGDDLKEARAAEDDLRRKLGLQVTA